ncbi:ABC transporter permease subunit (plasmid) [Rathayibacter sp. VKM Ac-2803]|uniref:ABC transporter permease n=1 Tax=Rathayibacter caricis DSM 15933 TaxID=1328867 RepID=A0A2T4UNR4_9MICO|nr:MULTISPECIES: sugar ABC transporter permease [Rathayibacter]MWV51339.1 ABC transporter permease subunit [Rathayibacter sp. VKM Ac-2803]PTL71178.1 ABC transporter permease [Rathayibacter caricis DSM 15933]
MTTTTTTPAATPAVTTGAAPRRRPSRRRRGRAAPYLFLLPALVLFVVFMVVPIIYATWLSFQTYRLQGGGILGTRVQVFAGLDNYVSALTNPELLVGFGHLSIYAVIAVPVTLGLALLFALLLDVPAARATRFARTAIFIPYAVPGVIAALLWGFLYLPGTSPFSDVSITLGGGAIPFLDETGIFGSIANIAIWGGVGFNMIIIFTSLRGIPADIYEAARIDGANEMQLALRIKIPLVVPALVLTGIFSVIGALQLYGEPTTLKPMTNVISQTWVPLMTIYRDAFLTDDLPSAAALSVVLAVGTVALSALVLGITRRRTAGVSE